MGNKSQEKFQKFYTEWKEEQKQELHRLIAAVEAAQHPQTNSPPPPPMAVLVAVSLAHYEEYYTTKSKFAETHVLVVLSPPWTNQLENAFIWVGGWRPTTAFHLLYSKLGLQLEAKFSAAAAGGTATPPPLDLSDLSSEQLRLIDQLQRVTVAEERRITEKVAKQQEKVADSEMVELSRGASGPESTRGEGLEGIIGKLKCAVKLKEEGFQKLLQRADDLRLRTLKAVIGILTPIQAVHFLIAAGELHLRLHEWVGEKEEIECNPCNVDGHVSDG